MKASESLMLIVIAFILGAVVLKAGEFLLEELETPLKPITEDWVLFVTKIEGESIQIRIMVEDFEDFTTFLAYISGTDNDEAFVNIKVRIDTTGVKDG